MTAYYNENDSFAAAWLRELMKRNLIAPGEVDERDIRQVRADDLRGFTQCHFFAGIGVWSYALRQAGWPDDERVWTGSCPCQPFSVSGKRAGASDERHLWPVWFPLIRESRPERVFGEQVASDDGLAWLDLVSADLEGQDYTVGAVDTPACGFGAPHRRQRLYWVADSGSERRQQIGGSASRHEEANGRSRRNGSEPDCDNFPASVGAISVLADATSGNSSDGELQRSGQYGQFAQDGGTVPLADAECNGRRADLPRRCPEGREADGRGCATLRLADSEHAGHDRAGRLASLTDSDQPGERLLDGDSTARELGESNGAGYALRIGQPGNDGAKTESAERKAAIEASATNGFWRDAEWLWCRDQKYRPVEARTFPLAHGIAKRVGKLRGFGNALVAPQAQAFIEAYRRIVACHERTGS